MTRWLIAMATAGALVLGASSAVRAESAAADRIKYKKRTVIDLTGAVIEGELTRPEGSYIVNRKVSRFSRLINTRKDFVPELMASADML